MIDVTDSSSMGFGQIAVGAVIWLTLGIANWWGNRR
jgi:hypothetical protein